MTSLGLALIGAGRLGAAHARTLARMPEARLVVVADPRPEAQDLAHPLGAKAVAEPETAREYGEAGRRRCIAEFSWAHIAEQTLEIYRKVSA